MYNMAIQQSVNQLLNNFTIATGLYAHQPSVQKKRVEKQEYKTLNEEYNPQTETTKIGREGLAAEQGLINAGLSPEEAEYKSIPFHQEDMERVKRLAELETDPKRKEELYTAAGYTQGMIEQRTTDYAEFLKKQAEEEEKKQAVMAAAIEQEQKTKETRQNILEGSRQFIPKPREVIRYNG